MNSTERRRYMRITDTVGVAYRTLSGTETDARADSGVNPAALITNLRRHDSLIKQRLSDLDDPILLELLTALNKKIDCVIDQMELDNQLLGRLANKMQEVNISVSGMAFVADDDLMEGKTLSLDIALYPSEQHLFTYGTVVGVEPLSHRQGAFVRVAFYGMDEVDQNLLMQHVVQRQSRILQAAREGRK